MQKTEVEHAVFYQSWASSLETVLFFQAEYQWTQVLGCFDCVFEVLEGTFHMY
jgi:hypothetical protein